MSSSRKTRDDVARLQAELADVQAKAAFGVGASNVAALVGAAPGVNQGAGGPTIVAVLTLPALYTGIFRWAVKAQATCAAADVSTWTVSSQTSAAGTTPTYTGAAVLTLASAGVGSNGILLPGASSTLATTAISNSAAAGTGITFATGGGASKTQDTSARTIGASATLADFYSASGYMINVAAATPPLLAAAPPHTGQAGAFAVGSMVALCLAYTNSAANRAISGITMWLEELKG